MTCKSDLNRVLYLLHNAAGAVLLAYVRAGAKGEDDTERLLWSYVEGSGPYNQAVAAAIVDAMIAITDSDLPDGDPEVLERVKQGISWP